MMSASAAGASRMVRSATRLLIFVMVLASCRESPSHSPMDGKTRTETPAAMWPALLEGVVTDLHVSQEGGVDSFDLTQGSGESIDVSIDPTTNYGFSLNHLRRHLRTSQPVVVLADRRGRDVIALSIHDG